MLLETKWKCFGNHHNFSFSPTCVEPSIDNASIMGNGRLAFINKIIAEETGRPLEQVEKDTDRDYWMSVEEAIEYGIVNKVVKSVAEIG